MLLFIIRHGDPIYNPDSLTPKGHLQAAAVGKRLARNGINKIFASPKIRAQMTAQPLGELLHLQVQIEEWTSEDLAWADLSFDQDGRRRWFWMLPVEQLVNDETVSLREKWYEIPAIKEHAEDLKRGEERIAKASDEFLSRLGYVRQGALYRVERPSCERVAVFCHEGFSKMWTAHLMCVPPHLMSTDFEFNHSSVTVMEFRNTASGLTRPRCLGLSDISHYYAEGLPMQFSNDIYI